MLQDDATVFLTFAKELKLVCDQPHVPTVDIIDSAYLFTLETSLHHKFIQLLVEAIQSCHPLIKFIEDGCAPVPQEVTLQNRLFKGHQSPMKGSWQVTTRIGFDSQNRKLQQSNESSIQHVSTIPVKMDSGKTTYDIIS